MRFAGMKWMKFMGALSNSWDFMGYWDRQPMGYSEFMMFSRDLQATSYDDWVSENEVYPQLASHHFGKRKKHPAMIHQWIGSHIFRPTTGVTSGVFRPHATLW